jgi:hypothetical protein
MRKFYLVGGLRWRPARLASREPHPLQPRISESAPPPDRKSLIVQIEFAMPTLLEARKLPLASSRRPDLRPVGSTQTAAGQSEYRSPISPVTLLNSGGAQVAQLVEHVTENHGVGGSIPPLGTKYISAAFHGHPKTLVK